VKKYKMSGKGKGGRGLNMSGPSDILIQPSQDMLSGTSFTESDHCVVLGSGVAVSRSTADASCSDAGFVKCPLSEYAYAVKKSADVFKNKTLEPKHLDALRRRLKEFQTQVEAYQERLDYMITVEPPTYSEVEQKLEYLQPDDLSEPEDNSDDELTDYTSFESTPYALLITRLKKLKTFRDDLQRAIETNLANGKKINAAWLDAAWRPPADSRLATDAKAATERRAARKAEREERRVAIQARRGANQAVHNVHVLNKQIPKKWFKANPNVQRAADYEFKERAKQGWLTEAEEEDLEEEEADKLKLTRIEEWKASQPPIPALAGSVRRFNWALRLYRSSWVRYAVTQRVESLEAAGEQLEKQLWQNQLRTNDTRVADTRLKVAACIAKCEARGDAEGAAAIKQYFEDCEGTGRNEVERHVAAKKAAAEAAAKKAAEEAAAAEKAAEKAKLKAEAEARGEEYVDPDGEEGEGDDEDE